MGKWLLLATGLLLLLVFSGLFYLSWGPMDIGFWEGFRLLGSGGREAYVVWQIRFPRLLMAMVSGFSLGLAGAAMQGFFRNPLVSPGLVGVSSGAAMFAAFAIVLGNRLVDTLPEWMGTFGMAGFSFLGALCTMLGVYALAKQLGRGSVLTLILAGLAITAFAESIIGLLRFFSSDAQLRDLAFWQMGSLGGASFSKFWISLGVLFLACLMLFPTAKSLNALALGEENAGFLGISVVRTEFLVLLGSALAVGVSVAFCGVIAFVGLMVPHMVRLVLGPDHRRLLPMAGLAGALLLLWSDGLARNLVAPAEIPISVITALMGSPFMVWLMFRRGKKSGL